MLRIFIVLFLFSGLTHAQSNCKGFIDWKEDDEVLVYNKPYGKAIDTLKYQAGIAQNKVFTIIDQYNRYFKVKIEGAANKGSITGWIRKTGNLKVYLKDFKGEYLNLYGESDKESEVLLVIKEQFEKKLTILECDGQWTKLLFTYNSYTYIGWIPSDQLCYRLSECKK